MYEYARTDMPISFPGLFGEWSINPDPVAIPIGNGIRWYGIIICAGLILAVLFCCRQSKKYGITEDNVYDMMIWQIPLCIIGARVYYVLFNLDFFRRTPPVTARYELTPSLPEDFPYEAAGIPRDYVWSRGTVEGPSWRDEGHVIWGMTARIVKDLIQNL